MTNSLIFKSGNIFPICPADAADAPRMMGGGWRWWHVEATCADAAAALESGVVRREYESVTGVDEDGNPVTEVLREDLSAYTVPGSVCDHMDGTCTVFARPQTEVERTGKACALLGVDVADPQSAPARLAEIQALVAHADMAGEDDIIVSLPVTYAAPWEPGKSYQRGRMVAYKGVKYLLQQDATAQEHYPPDMPNGAMLAVYKPYQGKHGFEWLYGEYCKEGFTRRENGVLYVCTAHPNANIFPPSQVPACWQIVAE